MVDRNTLLDQLKKYNDSQLEELIFRLEVDNTHLRTGGTRSQIAIDLIRYLEPQAYGLQRLQGVLRDLAFFREFTPAGTYLVGDELRQREEAREHEAMQAAAVHRAEPEDAQVTPEKFYSFQHGTEWLGVFREWDTPRSFRAELLATTICNSQNRRNCPAAAIIGHGGSGKSVALRRLALDLVTAGYKVWWVEEPERLVEFGLTAFMAMGDEIHFLLIDDIQDLDLSYVRRLQQHLQKHPSLVLVVAGRNLPANLRLGAKEKFIPDEMADRVAILDKITRILPAWADAASQLKAESLRQARLIRILVVLARRQDPIPKTLAELEEAFLQILVDDLQKIRDQFPGLATAIMDAAVILKLGAYNIARSSLLALADQHQPHAGIPTLFAQRDNNPRWELVESLLSYDPIYDGFQFHHDELAEGLIRASQERLAEPYIDDAYRKFILDVIVNQAIALKERVADDPGIAYTSSYVLNLFICQYPALVGEATALHYIRQLLAARIGHHAYLKLIVHSVLKLNRQERLALLLTAAQVSPDTNFLWSPVRRWVQGTYPREQQAEILQQLYQAGCRGTMILHGLLECLPLEQAKAQAREWIQTSQTLTCCAAVWRCWATRLKPMPTASSKLVKTKQCCAAVWRC